MLQHCSGSSYLFIIKFNTVFPSIIYKAASTQPICRVIPHQDISFCDALEHFLFISFLAQSPHLGEGCWEETLETPQCRRCLPPSPHIPALPPQAASQTCACAPSPCLGFCREVTRVALLLFALLHSGPKHMVLSGVMV